MLTKLFHNAFRSQFSRAMSVVKAEMDPIQASLLDESCILVDENDNVIGEASKRDCHAVKPGGELLLHRAFSMFLFNSKNELLLQKRSPYKITYPNHYTNTCCSHPLASINGETEEFEALGIRRAAQRRLAFELGIPAEQACPEDMHYITRIIYKHLGDGEWGEHEVDYILFMKGDLDLEINPNEVSEIQYIGLNEFDEFVSDVKVPLTPWFHLIKEKKLKYWWENLDRLDKITDHKNIVRF